MRQRIEIVIGAAGGIGFRITQSFPAANERMIDLVLKKIGTQMYQN